MSEREREKKIQNGCPHGGRFFFTIKRENFTFQEILSP
jgi:hypothetical protein